MKAVARAWAQALGAALSARMLLLSLAPLLLALLVWGALLWAWGPALFDALQGAFADYGVFQPGASVLAQLGLGALKVVLVPLVAILLLLPVMIASALLFIGLCAMPLIAGHVSGQRFAGLERKGGGSFAGSLWINLSSVLVFALLWLLTLPLYAVAPLAVLVQALLWGWVCARVMSYDALAAHASAAERRTLVQAQRWPLLAIGIASGLLGALPGLAWIGGAVLAVALFPFLAILSAWLYLLIFLFTGLWFQYFCLQALASQRAAAATSVTAL